MNNQKNYRIVFSDVDGTLLNKQRELSDYTVLKIKNISLNKNVKFVMVSARMPQGMLHLYNQISIDSPVICYNGALIVKTLSGGFNTNNVIHSNSIDSEIASNLFLEAENKNLHFGLFSNNVWFVNKLDEWALREENNTRVKPVVQTNITELINRLRASNKPIHKLMIMGEAPRIEKYVAFSNHNFANKVCSYRSKDTYVEISPVEVNKAIGCSFIMNYLGIAPEESIAFGDNYNDIEMLKLVGLGVAMENAPSEVKLHAKHIAPSNLNEGVAHTLTEIFI